MNSIFLRIYGGMVLVCVLIGILFYASLEAINFVRLALYRDDLITGPIQLIAEMTATKPFEQQPQWVLGVGHLLDVKMELVEESRLTLNKRDVERARSGRLVVNMLSNFSRHGEAVIKVSGAVPRYIVVRGEYMSEQQAKAMAELVSQHLAAHPVKQWDTELQKLNHSFGFPLKRVPPFDVSLDDDKKRRLFNDEEAVTSFVGNRGSNSQIYSYKLLPDTGEVLMLGPQHMFDWYPFELMAMMLIIAMALVGFGVYMLVKPLETRLSGVEKAVLRIRGGDLDARAPVEGSDAIGQLAGTLNGMTEHIQRLLTAQKELTRAVSHELRTPVARIRFGLEMMIDAANDEQRLKTADAIDNDIEQLDKLIDEILTYSKLEEGTPVLDFKMIDIDKLLRRLEQESQSLAGNKQVIYRVPNLPEERHWAEGEERYIHRVVQNFVGNGLRYARSKVVITYTVVGDVFRIDVEDDGPGIPEADRKRVFQPFTRLDDSRTRASGGYGLGLSIVARIAYWHGGRARVTQSDLGGARFSFLWPRLQSLRESN